MSYKESLPAARMEPNTSNDDPAIQRLPAEVLALIFSIVVNSNIILRSGKRPRKISLDHANVVASICSRWRSIALGTPSLWSYIDFAGVRSLEHVALLLDRSRGFPLDVIIMSDNISPAFNSIVPLVLPRLNCLNSIYFYYPAKVLIEQWLSEWLQSGNPATLTNLTLYCWRGGLEFPPRLKDLPQERLDNLLSSVSTVFLRGVNVNLERTVFCNLTTLNFKVLYNHPAFDPLVQILLASPLLESLQLDASFEGSGFAIDRQPIPLTQLHTLELSLNQEFMTALIAMLMPGRRDLTFKMDLSDLSYPDLSDEFKAESRAFFERSTVKTLYFSGFRALAHIATAPDVETLILNDMAIDDAVCDTISPPTNSNAEPPVPMQSPWPKLHTIHAIDCVFNDIEGFKRVLSNCSIRELRIDSDCMMYTRGNQERFEDWAGPGVDFGTRCRGWAIGYAPFPYPS